MLCLKPLNVQGVNKMMNDHVIALFRTMMPMVFGLVIGIGSYFLFFHVSPAVLALVLLSVVAVYLFITLFESNLASVRKERGSESSSN